MQKSSKFRTAKSHRQNNLTLNLNSMRIAKLGMFYENMDSNSCQTVRQVSLPR